MMYRCNSCGALNRSDPRQPGKPVCGRCKRSLDLSGPTQEVDGAALERTVAAAPVPVLVDFWAPWCGPCRAVAPTVERIARANAGQLIVLKLNTEQDPVAAGRLEIRSIPTFILFMNGRVADRRSGAMPNAALASWVASVTATR